jgi:hypothetical protein
MSRLLRTASSHLLLCGLLIGPTLVTGCGGDAPDGAAPDAAGGGGGDAGRDPDAEPSGPDPWADLLYFEDFEGDNPFTGPLLFGPQKADVSYSLQYTTDLVFAGSRSARFELRDTDPEVASGTRTEVAFVPESARERWYGFAAYFPADAWGYDSFAEVIAQWHSFPDEHLGENWGSPPTKLLVHRGKLRFDVGYNDAPDSNAILGDMMYDLGPVVTDTWREFVFHIYHSHAGDGIVEVWVDGVKVVEHVGGNTFNDDQLPFWKFGIYKWNWNGTNTTDVSRRVLYMDNVRIAGPR